MALLFACRNKDPQTVSVVWSGNRAVAVRIPFDKIPDTRENVAGYVTVRLYKAALPVLGSYRLDNGLLFEPLIPFSAGAEYVVYYKQDSIAAFTISIPSAAHAPEVLDIYPRADTLPVNLLKVYVQFSQPMQENVSGRYVKLVKNGADTLNNVFLDLQPELWDTTGTLLTLWLDPGRIKRDLQPNQRLGNPLDESVQYTLVVSEGWKDKNGLTLKKTFLKSFITGPRSDASPMIESWRVYSPQPGARSQLIIDLLQPMDHFLLTESVAVLDADGKTVQCVYTTANEDRFLQFTPQFAWKAGMYRLVVRSRLEDLAGNNINRPFDRDVTKTQEPSVAAVHTRTFSIQ